MSSNNIPISIIFLLFTAFTYSACAPLGTAVFGSVFGVAGQQGVGYFSSGTTSRIFYCRMDRSIYSVEKSFYDLSITMEKKERYSNGTIRIAGKTESPKVSHVQVNLESISPDITEIKIKSKQGILPDKTVAHTLMRKIVENLNGAMHVNRKKTGN